MSSGTWVSIFWRPYNAAKCQLNIHQLTLCNIPDFNLYTVTVYTWNSLWHISWYYYYCHLLDRPLQGMTVRYTALKQLPTYSTLNMEAQCSAKTLVSDQTVSWFRDRNMNRHCEHFWSYRITRMISGFCHDVDKICTLLGYYAASNGNPLPTFRENISVPSFKGQERTS
jgi:hypothetical protein